MTEIKVPFSMLPPKPLLVVSKKLLNWSAPLLYVFPNLRESLAQAELDIQARDYLALCLSAALFNGLFMSLIVFFVGLVAKQNVLVISAVIFALLFFASLFTNAFYPQIIATQRSRKVEEFLISATRQLLIEVKAGVPLFHAMASISDDYGEVSHEFRKIVKKINSGMPELDALAEATASNPSPLFRKLLWQISNSLKTGSDVAGVLETSIDELMRLKVQQIRAYGQELSPWTMIYMMAAVIVPSLGLTMLIVVTSFVNFSIPKIILPGILVFQIGFQLFFINFVGSRRPTI